ncbi:hypothetical protein [Paraclostridium bifermentans]|uniref:hypothetical protein n=1 Tax=Paraclostridium bifermentans TaxID=1490 RepID=UPI000E680549|nr:hypothetical protein [Paraclostridium bifermentans]RIZ57405.1 hypothetical protein CHH45_16330 [Paraclostridium bifermentans]
MSNLTIVTPKANQAKPSPPRSSDIQGEVVTITAPTGCKIRFENAVFDSPHTFRGLNPNTTYQFYAFTPGTDKLNESPNSDALMVQTLNQKMLFGDDMNYPLANADVWKQITNTSYGSDKAKLTITPGNMKLYTGNVNFAHWLDLQIKTDIDVSKYNKLTVVVKTFHTSDPTDNQNEGRIGISGTRQLLKAPGTYEFDVSALTQSFLSIRVDAWVNDSTTMEISSIYLSN